MTLLYNDKEQGTETTSHPVQMRKESKATYVSAGLFKQHQHFASLGESSTHKRILSKISLEGKIY